MQSLSLKLKLHLAKSLLQLQLSKLAEVQMIYYIIFQLFIFL